MSTTTTTPPPPPSPWPSAEGWRRLAPWLVLATLVLALFRDTVTAMVGIWLRSDTFTHAFLVPPIVAYLVWRRRALLATLPQRPVPWLLLPMLALLLMWQLAQLAGVNAAAQFAVVALLVLGVPMVCGWAVARALTFPLLFSFFCVPIGEFMVPPMMNWTADFAAAAVRASGIPLYREGLQFVIPSGSWSVVEACSGVRYLIASFMVGTLFAYLNYDRPGKRLAFMVASLLVPIVANWLRAYMIVMIGHLSDNKLAAGVDHLIYGWVFFGIVIGIMFMVGARFADPEPAEPVMPAVQPGQRPAWVAVVLPAVVLLVGTQWFNARLDRTDDSPLPTLALPSELPGGWVAADPQWTTWVPAYSNAALSRSVAYRQGETSVGVWLAYYRNQGYDRKMVTSSNNLVDVEARGPWAQTASGVRDNAWPGGPSRVRTADLRGSNDPGRMGAQRLRVWQVYWVDGRWVTRDAEARIRIALARLLGRGDSAMTVFLYAAWPITAEDPGAADTVLSDFSRVAGPAIQRTADALSR